MKIVIQCSDAQRVDAQEVAAWIRDGEFDTDIDIEIEIQP
jgi:hypothetical protein